MSLSTTPLAFNDCITRHDLEGLSALMTEDHTFIDRDNNTVKGKAAMTNAWREFFKQFPDYKNTFMRVEARGDKVVMIGYATWSKGAEPDPAIWVARIENGLVMEWRIYYDTDENRKMLGV
ncbi:MAG: nuclear transport factor 2 family protein [Candidatus Zixiibacteriota bacterium]